MSDPIIARFADACGATSPLDLQVNLAGGEVLAEGTVDQPFTLVGRDDACDVTLSDPEVNMRHAWFQVIGGRLFAIDLGSRTGLIWPNGSNSSGWLDVGTPVRIGPFLIHLRTAITENPSVFPAGYNPLASDTGAKIRASVTLEFRNGRRVKDRWSVNRLVTLIGQAADCKIHLNADDIAAYHCGIVSTRTGLWVVDLSGRGVVVNGERMRLAALPQGAELLIGRFLIGCQYQDPQSDFIAARPFTPTPQKRKSSRKATASPSGSISRSEARITTTPPAQPKSYVSRLDQEDEVEIGDGVDGVGLPASHIMADVFRQGIPGGSDSLSNPILVSGSGPKPQPVPPAPGSQHSMLLNDPALAAAENRNIAPILRQMSDLHLRAAVEFQQSQALLALLFARVKREHLAELVHELTRIQELTVEITSLQTDIAKQSLTLITNEPVYDSPSSSVTDNAPSPENTPPPKLPTTAAGSQNAEKLAALQQTRATRWQALLALFAGM